jgi:large subunit ribosomal protein L29
MKVTDFRDLAIDELRQRAKDMDDQLFRLRIQKSMGQLEAAHKLKALRRDLARVKTVLREKETAQAAGRLAGAREPKRPAVRPAPVRKDQSWLPKLKLPALSSATR